MALRFKFIGQKQITKWLIRHSKAIKDMKKVFNKIGDIMVFDIKEHFRKEEGPSGAWKSLSPVTLKLRRQKGIVSGRILYEYGTLYESIRKLSVTDRGVRVGTDVPYAKIHQQKGKQNTFVRILMFGRIPVEIPARPFLWLSSKAEKEILKTISIYINKVK